MHLPFKADFVLAHDALIELRLTLQYLTADVDESWKANIKKCVIKNDILLA